MTLSKFGSQRLFHKVKKNISQLIFHKLILSLAVTGNFNFVVELTALVIVWVVNVLFSLRP